MAARGLPAADRHRSAEWRHGPARTPTCFPSTLLRLCSAGADPVQVATAHPSSSAAWAALAEEALGRGFVVEAYAYARTGYHRGLDALRRSGWRGTGPVPWSHAPNQGFLRALYCLTQAAGAINEDGRGRALRQVPGRLRPGRRQSPGLSRQRRASAVARCGRRAPGYSAATRMTGRRSVRTSAAVAQAAGGQPEADGGHGHEVEQVHSNPTCRSPTASERITITAWFSGRHSTSIRSHSG